VETRGDTQKRWAHTVSMVFGVDRSTHAHLVGVSLEWLTQGNPKLRSAWENWILTRATKLRSSCGYSVLAQNLSSEEISVKHASLPDRWVHIGHPEGYPVEETESVVNVAIHTQGQLLTADFGYTHENWGNAVLIYQIGVARLADRQTPLQQKETKLSIQARLTKDLDTPTEVSRELLLATMAVPPQQRHIVCREILSMYGQERRKRVFWELQNLSREEVRTPSV
jgi:hypothetical protein